MELTSPEMKLYVFSFMSRTDGVVGSLLSQEETLEKLTNEMEATFGSEGFKIIELRPATDEEVLEIQTQVMAGEETTPAASNSIN